MPKKERLRPQRNPNVGLNDPGKRMGVKVHDDTLMQVLIIADCHATAEYHEHVKTIASR